MYDCSADTGLFCQLTNVGKSDSSLAGHISLRCSWLWRCLIGFNGYCQKDTAAQMQAGQCCVLSLFLSFLPYNESWSLNPQLWSSFSEDYSPRPPTRQLLLLLTTGLRDPAGVPVPMHSENRHNAGRFLLCQPGSAQHFISHMGRG